MSGSSKERFKITKVSRYGIHQQRFLEVSQGDMHFLAGSNEKKTVAVSSIVRLEKNDKEKNRLVLIFSEGGNRPYELIFVDRSNRDVFIEMLLGFNRGLNIAEGQTNGYNWIPDKQTNNCMNPECHMAFSMTNRRHHCRSCGGIFCGACSERQASLGDLGYSKAVRVCDCCVEPIVNWRLRSLNEPRTEGIATTSVPFQAPKAPTQSARRPPKSANLGFSSPRPRQRSESDPYRGAAMDSPISSTGFSPLTRQRESSFDVLDEDNVQRDRYGFEVPSSVDDGGELNFDDPAYAEKQRTRWDNYLLLHTSLEPTPDLKKLVRKGVPFELRGRVWQLICGSKAKQGQFEPGHYLQLVERIEGMKKGSQTASKSSMAVYTEVEKDLHRTFPDNAHYKTDQGLATLRRVLLAYSMHNTTIGYCQSMNFICALLLLFMEEEDAFWLMATIVEDITVIDMEDSPLLYHQADLVGAHVDQQVFKDLVAEKLPKIAQHFDKHNFLLEPVTLNWFLCLFVNTLPLETTLHLWDCMLFEGIKVIFRAALTLLKLNEKELLKATSFEMFLDFFRTCHFCARDPHSFLKACFDPLTLGSFSLHKITDLRTQYRPEIEQRLKDASRRRNERKGKSIASTILDSTSTTPASASAAASSPIGAVAGADPRASAYASERERGSSGRLRSANQYAGDDRSAAAAARAAAATPTLEAADRDPVQKTPPPPESGPTLLGQPPTVDPLDEFLSDSGFGKSFPPHQGLANSLDPKYAGRLTIFRHFEHMTPVIDDFYSAPKTPMVTKPVQSCFSPSHQLPAPRRPAPPSPKTLKAKSLSAALRQLPPPAHHPPPPNATPPRPPHNPPPAATAHRPPHHPPPPPPRRPSLAKRLVQRFSVTEK